MKAWKFSALFSIVVVFVHANDNSQDANIEGTSENVIRSNDLGSLISMINAQYKRWNLNADWMGVHNAKESATDLSGCQTAVQILLGKEATGSHKLRGMLDDLLQSASKIAGFDFGFFPSCQSLPDKKSEAECDEVLHEHAVQVLSLSKIGKPIDSICQSIFSSKNSVEAGILVVAGDGAAIKASPISCKLCKSFVELVDAAIKDDLSKVEELRELIGDLCDTLSSDSMCHVILSKYDQVVKWLKDGSDSKVICREISMCVEEYTQSQQSDEATNSNLLSQILSIPQVPEHSFDESDDHGCMYCTAITQVIQFVDKNQKDYLPTLKKVIKYACKLTPTGCQCDELEKHFDEIVKMVEDGKEPRAVCESIGICSKTFAMKSQNALDVAAKSLTQQLDLSASSNICLYCDAITMAIRAVLEEDPDQINEVRTYADMLCEILGEDSPCHGYVKKLDQVIDDLKAGKHPRDICVSLKYCESKFHELSSNTQLTVARQTNSWPSCIFCDAFAELISVATKLDEVLPLKRAVVALCVVLPPDMRCDTLNMSFEEIVDQVREGVSSLAACSKIGMCAEGTSAKAESNSNKLGASTSNDLSQAHKNEESQSIESILSKE